MKRVGIIWLAYTAIMGILCILDEMLSGFVDYDFSLFSSIVFVMVMVWLGLSLLFVFGTMFQSLYMKTITKKMNNDELITLYSDMYNKPYKLCFINDKNVILGNLGIMYLMKNDSEKAKYYLNKINIKRLDFPCFYPKFILAIYDNDLDEMDKYYKLIMKTKNKKITAQKELAVKLKQMIDLKTFDESIYSSTQYEIIKEICLRYKN